nr:hypothetical protein Iba_chr10aCG14220 [Ipomoea batatas]GMD44016.1 hypothetical protein Iba_chr10cCG10880 [Ipomoea batatas]GMD45705.1 hypothetical protein Iba_chr10dCG12650 [Ipomoea batatas]GMD47428.1 hypothetical protein Iba_chr10eCG12870 [Ipomoea batatas]GMD48626.1 hypothetical protein Iba_chr10fCG8170 [Ipomoea batatas]
MKFLIICQKLLGFPHRKFQKLLAILNQIVWVWLSFIMRCARCFLKMLKIQ